MSMPTSLKPCETQQRLLQIVELLANDVVVGMSNSQIAKALDIAPPYITRDLQNLELRKWVTYHPQTERWVLGVAISTIAVRAVKSIADAEERLSTLKTRFS